MEVSMERQLRLILDFFVFGFASGILYDAVRIIRICIGAYDYMASSSVMAPAKRLLKHFNIDKHPVRCKRYCSAATVITDVIYSLTVGIAFIIYLYHENYCIFRWYLLVGAAVGFFAYYFTVARIVITVAGAVVSFAEAAMRKAVTALLVPIKLLYHFLIRVLHALWRCTFGKLVLYIKKKRGEKRTAASKARLCELLKI